MIKTRIEELENAISELWTQELNYINRITLETYYHHLYKLYQKYNSERW